MENRYLHSYILQMLVISIISLKHFHCWNRVKFGSCDLKQNSFRVFYDISLQKCKAECGKRQFCRVMHYRKPHKRCMLYSEPSVTPGNDVMNCVIIMRDDIEGLENDCTCDENRVCHNDGTCGYNECPPVHIAPERGNVYGNVLDIGSKVKVTCTASFHRKPDKDVSMCNSVGQWEELPACLIDCGNSCTQYPYCDLDAVGGTLEGEHRYFTCNSGFYSSVDPTSDKIHLTCTTHGWYTIPNAYCRSDTVFPLNPAGIWYRGCSMFEFNTETTTKDIAKTKCRAYGDLFKVDVAHNQWKIEEYLNKTETRISYWIQGISVQSLYGETKWYYDDATTMTFQKWGSGQQDTSGLCVVINGTNNYKWNAIACTEMHGYICEYNKRATTWIG